LGLKSVGGLGVVVVVVVVAGEAAAWAETITVLTTGLTQRSGKTSGLNEVPPPTQPAKCVGDRRSLKASHWARSVRHPRTLEKYSIARFHSSPPANES
jgi:hypothetical protein